MSFVANGNSTKSNITIASKRQFFPTIALDDIKQDVRIDGSVTDARVKQALLEEIIDVNRLLADLVQPDKTLIGLATDIIDGKADTDILYFSAVANGVAAKIAEKYRSYDSTNSGNKRAEELSATINEYKRNKVFAIQQLKGENHSIVELI